MSERAALVERMAEAIEQQFELGYTATAIDFASVALAAVEAAGWGPRPEADAKVTAAKMRLLDLLRLEQVEAMGEEHMTALFGTVQEHVELISRGITVEGAE